MDPVVAEERRNFSKRERERGEKKRKPKSSGPQMTRHAVLDGFERVLIGQDAEGGRLFDKDMW